MSGQLPSLIRKLGEGGMGEVWLADDPARGMVAVKQLRLELSGTEGLARFRAEFATLARLRHVNLVEAYDYLVYPSGRHGYTMQYVDGLDFTAATGGLAVAEVLKLAEQVCEALEHVHAHDLIHGDIKPGNLLVRDGRVKLMDFGLAEAPGPRGVRGSLDYLAPEVIQGRPRDRRADLYALGAVLFEALTRHTPFHGASRFSLLRAHLRSHAEFPERTLPGVGEPVRRVVMRLLCKDPAARYFTAAETAEALRAARGAGGRRDLAPGAIGGSGAVAGREKEMDALEEALRRAASGAGPEARVVEGPAGSGKSALLRAFAARLASRHVAHAWASGAREGAPLAAAREWLAALAAHATPEWPRLRGAIAAIDAGSEGAWEQAAAALESRARREPLVLLLAAAEWTDAASAELVDAICSRSRARLLVAAAATSREGTSPWEGIPRIVLEPLGHDAVAEVARDATGASAVDVAFAGALHAASGGNPGAVRACLRALAAEGELRIQDGTLIASAPPVTGPGIERALAFLGTDARLAAEALAVLGRAAAPGDVARVAGLSGERAAAALFDLERRSVAVRERDRVRLSAPALSPSLLSSAPPESVRAMHRAAADLARAASLPEAAARHLFDAGGGPDAVAAALEAARHAAAADPRAAAALLERALADPACTGADRSAARPMLAEGLARRGDPARAAQLFEAMAREAPPAGRDALVMRAARLLAPHDPPRALALLQPLAASTERDLHLAEAFFAAGRFAESLASARDRSPDSRAAAARAFLALGRFEESADAALAAAEAFEAAGADAAAASAALLAAEAAAGCHDAGAASAAAALASLAAERDPAAAPAALAARACVASLKAPPSEALAAWRRAAEIARDGDALSRAATGAARVLAAHDRLGEAADAADEAVAARPLDRRLRFDAALAASEAASRLGRHAAARNLAQSAIDAVSPAGPSRALARARAALASASLAAGEPADAPDGTLAALELALAANQPDAVLAAAPHLPPSGPLDAGALAELRARALASLNEPTALAAAVDEFYDVLGRARDLGSPGLSRKAHAGLGRALHALGMGRSARDHLRLALDLLRDALTHVPPADREAFLELPENRRLRAAILSLGAPA